MLDQKLEFQSQTPQFSDALRTYLLVHLTMDKHDEMAAQILEAPGVFSPPLPILGYNPMKEIYANIYANADGDISKIPPDFQKFYKETP